MSLSSDRPMQKAAAQNLVKSNKALRNKADYLKRKVKSLQSELEKCKKDMCAESYMEVSEKAGKIPIHLMNIHLEKVKTDKTVYQYDDAISLRLKSKSGYRYIRQCFGEVLPHEKTIQKWCSKDPKIRIQVTKLILYKGQ